MANKTEKSQNMPNGHLHELFVDELRDILGAERQLLKGLKKMASAAISDSLTQAFENHYAQTEGQIERLKQVFQSIGLSARGKKCKAMEGLLEEAEEIIDSFEDQTNLLDAALIAAAQKVEHYEIASYGCLVTYAKLMEHREAAELLGATLAEEKETDNLLTDIAMKESNTGQAA
ncbi:YciE/YciF family protein [Parapedobacter defluvii]|uniref:YciE/YciF family protein n=1 Tax=Parapedobacter defluvii TaxID=2045106 RepID=A0ABQ1MNW4_9SPHI|nr:ferritin-like domain-containing protein [Parapedobacter defluvii]RQP18695.1 MAG: ferritin-like domain-containing protein [Parapedobacter sp.]GGC43915.1 YciE/YciF family protein [Parapedobacter defluvii]